MLKTSIDAFLEKDVFVEYPKLAQPLILNGAKIEVEDILPPVGTPGSPTSGSGLRYVSMTGGRTQSEVKKSVAFTILSLNDQVIKEDVKCYLYITDDAWYIHIPTKAPVIFDTINHKEILFKVEKKTTLSFLELREMITGVRNLLGTTKVPVAHDVVHYTTTQDELRELSEKVKQYINHVTTAGYLLDLKQVTAQSKQNKNVFRLSVFGPNNSAVTRDILLFDVYSYNYGTTVIMRADFNESSTPEFGTFSFLNGNEPFKSNIILTPEEANWLIDDMDNLPGYKFIAVN